MQCLQRNCSAYLTMADYVAEVKTSRICLRKIQQRAVVHTDNEWYVLIASASEHFLQCYFWSGSMAVQCVNKNVSYNDALKISLSHMALKHKTKLKIKNTRKRFADKYGTLCVRINLLKHYHIVIFLHLNLNSFFTLQF